MAGWDNDIGYSKNMDFTQADNQNVSEANGLATNGQIWIGTTAVNAGGTHVNVGTITSPGGSVTIGYSSPNITLSVPVPSVTPPLVTVFTDNGTWTKSTNPATKYITVYGVGGGSGGGSGRKGTSNASSGGGGGAGGTSFFFEGVASLFPSSATVVVGAGGAGGAAQTTDANNGNPGALGGVTSFGSNLTTGQPTAATGGTNVDSAGGVGQISTFTFFSGSRPSGQTGTTSNAPNINRDLSNYLSGSAGGGGSGAHATLQRLAAPAFSFVKSDATSLLAGGVAGNAAGDPNGGNGNVPLVSPQGITMAGTGGGGGAGTFISTLSGNGGNGAIPGGGGGGGGGGLDLVANSGAGGNGARGQVIVVEYF